MRAHFRRFRGLQEIGWAVPHHVRSSVQLYEYPYIFFDCNGANLLGPTVLQNARHENQQPSQAVTFCEVRIGNDVGQKWDAYFYRNNAVDARNYFNPAPEPVSVLLLNQFGASLGGAFIKKKWFYFVNYEGVRLPEIPKEFPRLLINYGEKTPQYAVVQNFAEWNPLHSWYTIWPPSQPAGRPITTTLEAELEKLKAEGYMERPKEEHDRRRLTRGYTQEMAAK